MCYGIKNDITTQSTWCSSSTLERELKAFSLKSDFFGAMSSPLDSDYIFRDFIKILWPKSIQMSAQLQLTSKEWCLSLKYERVNLKYTLKHLAPNCIVLIRLLFCC